MKTIVVPTDFSRAAEDAAFYAAEIALEVDAELILLHVLLLPLTVSEVPLPLDAVALSIEKSDNELNALKEKLDNCSKGKLSIATRTATDSFLEEINNLNNKKELFAIIMGTSGAGAAGAFFLGSFSLAAAKYLQYPLIVVPPDYNFSGIKKVGLACDMDHVLDHIPIKGIRAVFDNFDAKMEVLYVTDPEKTMRPEILRESKFIQICLAQYRPEIRIIDHESTRQGLENFVAKNDFDLLILLPKERSFIERIFHKSMSKGMVLHPVVPVMIVHH